MQLVTLAEQNTSLAYIWLTKGKKKKKNLNPPTSTSKYHILV